MASGLAATLGALPLRTAAARKRTVLGDASGLNAVSVFDHWIVRAEPEVDIVARLREEMKRAAAEKRPICASAARHSMGGQSLPRDGLAITFNIDRAEIDRSARRARVHAGTRWFEAIAHLDRLGFSPAVMQSNSDFGVASTFSVNAHGWPAPYGPFGSTVRSLRMMLADGSIMSCSRTENAELFALAMGGYGLFGVILDIEFDIVDNVLLEADHAIIPADDFAERFTALIRDDAGLRMVYGRLSVAHRSFMREALLVAFRPRPTPAKGLPPVQRTNPLSGLTRRVYRAQIGSEAAKAARWVAETSMAAHGPALIATRNTLMNQPVSALAGKDRSRTDILHEYFLAPDRLREFIEGCRAIIPKAKAQFLNVTLRYVRRDETSVLAYAPVDRIAAVMSFSQEISQEGEADMIRLTEALVDLAASLNGSFYLPYRLHSRQDQFEKVYPKADEFAERKHHYDPALVFRNNLWTTYFSR